MLDISISLVIIAFVVISFLLILVIMMQRPKQEGLGAAFGAGMTDAAFGARTTDVLQKGTVYLGTLFFVLALLLSVLMGKRNAIEGQRADAEGLVAESAEEATLPETAPALPEVDEFEKAKEAEKATTEAVETPATTEEETPAPAEEEAPKTPAGE